MAKPEKWWGGRKVSLCVAMAPSSMSKLMREATRSVHTLSDALVNAKLGVALTDDAVWAEGLLVFYEVFRYLEEALERRSDSLLGDLRIEEGGLLSRTEAFEKDLLHFMGKDWKDGYSPRSEVRQYLRHLEEIENSEPYLLAAYVYHLYMGLLSGGQILKEKRSLLGRRKEERAGEAVTHFGTEHSLPWLKKQMRDSVDHFGEQLDPDVREKVILEGVTVFNLNNTIIRSVRGVDDIFYRKLFNILSLLVLALGILAFFLYY